MIKYMKIFKFLNRKSKEKKNDNYQKMNKINLIKQPATNIILEKSSDSDVLKETKTNAVYFDKKGKKFFTISDKFNTPREIGGIVIKRTKKGIVVKTNEEKYYFNFLS